MRFGDGAANLVLTNHYGAPRLLSLANHRNGLIDEVPRATLLGIVANLVVLLDVGNDFRLAHLLVHFVFFLCCFVVVLKEPLVPLNAYIIAYSLFGSQGVGIILLVDIVELLEVFVALNELGEPALDILNCVSVVKGKMGFLARLVLKPGGVLATILG